MQEESLLLSKAPDSAGQYARIFDSQWLLSSHTHFECVGIINRLDRKFLNPMKKNCGELRYIYRLAFDSVEEGKKKSSRLPMTLALVYELPLTENQCREYTQMSYEEMKNKAKQVNSIEVNLQSSRWPSFKGSSFVEQAHYLMRVFEFQKGVLKPGLLENTPDFTKINSNPDLKEKLLHFLRSQESQFNIERGSIQIPKEFLAEKATSIAPFGMKRLANRPFSQIFKNNEVPERTLRRLDSLSCVGCHASRSIAGFHFLGEEKDRTRTFDALALPMSPYMEDNLLWRSVFLKSLFKRVETLKFP